MPGVTTGSVVQTTPALEELFQQLDGAHESPPEAQSNETFKRQFSERHQLKLPWLDQVTLRDKFAAARAWLDGVVTWLIRNGQFDEYRSAFFDMVTKGVATFLRRNHLVGRISVTPQLNVVPDNDRQPTDPTPSTK